MLHAQSHGPPYILKPGFSAFSRKAEHQVDADVADARLSQSLHCLTYLSCTVSAASKAQHLLRETLRSHAHPVYGRLREKFRKLRRNVVRVTLNGDFRTLRVHLIIFIDGFENLGYFLLRQLRWRTAAQVYRGDRLV